ncbi:Testis-expressed gene 21 [Apodemus speciosus]|uniref:Testis-expressed gene 21 n=1 Tax=Apodemus speciosus TaxID=105296 RepID=A0ABQ0FE78_APOSI
MACFDPPLEVDPTRNPIIHNKKAADPVHPDLAGLLVKNKTLLAELRNLQSKLYMKETSLQEMKTELESYKETNTQQALQIMSLRDDVKNLQDLIDSLMKIKILKNTNPQKFGRHNWDLTERVIDLENRLREHLLGREPVESQAELLEKRRPCPCRFSPHVNLKGPQHSLDVFPVKDNDEVCSFERDNAVYSEGPPIDGQTIQDKCQQDLIHKEKLRPEQSHHQDFLGQLATLLSDSIGPILATEEAVKERIQEMGANEQLWKCKTEALQQEIQTLTKRLEQLYHLYEDAAEGSPQTEGNYTGQKRPLGHLEGKVPVNCSPEELRCGQEEKVQHAGGDSGENSRIRTAHTEKHSKLKQLEMLLDVEQNSKMAAAPRMEEKIQRLQKQLSDLKLSNKNMKTQLTRINVLKGIMTHRLRTSASARPPEKMLFFLLQPKHSPRLLRKDKTIERLRQSLTKAETVREKTAAKTDNSKTPLDPVEQTARPEERAPKTPARSLLEPSTVRGVLKGLSGREQELLADFRETIMKMLGFNRKTADKDAINQLKLVIQIYEISKRSKMASHCEAGQAK